MTSVLLVYPYFRPRLDRSQFRFPPLGVAYVAAAVRAAGHDVRLLDCTFLTRDEAARLALAARADVVGISCLATLEDDALHLAGRLRGHCGALVAGGPLPTCEPDRFLGAFDLVVRGEGEQTMVELLDVLEAAGDPGGVPGVVAARSWGRGGGAAPRSPVARPFREDLDALAFPARDLLPNDAYIADGRRRQGAAVTTVMSTRGCPYTCDFCSNVVFGHSYRARSPENVVDELEEALALGYDRISFADDVFTLEHERVLAVCDEIARRRLRFAWECLGRVDGFDDRLARRMRAAGCDRVFFGIESGVDDVLRLMNKRTTAAQARGAVLAAHAAGLQVGAFFIVCYPGESDDTVLETLRFIRSLPLDYLGLTVPYPLPGTGLYDKVGGRVRRAWRPSRRLVPRHEVIYEGEFSALKMRAALVKGRAEFELGRRLGSFAPAALRLFERPSEAAFRRLS
jgi:anaerobic magnesium-protoporphyrin IX monomethyl ester cyclase